MSFSPQIERWRGAAASLASGLPVDLILAIIWHESRGTAGILSRGETKPAMVPSSTGDRKANHAFGLMQVIPRNVASWNSSHPGNLATWELMTGTNDTAARMQIRLGVWILRNAFAWLAKNYGFPWPGGPLSDEQVKIGLMIYAWGAANLDPYLEQLEQLGAPITAGEIATRWPDLGAPKNAPIKFSRTTYNKAFVGGGASIPVITKPAPAKHGAGLAIAAMLALYAAGRYLKW